MTTTLIRTFTILEKIKIQARYKTERYCPYLA